MTNIQNWHKSDDIVEKIQNAIKKVTKIHLDALNILGPIGKEKRSYNHDIFLCIDKISLFTYRQQYDLKY